MPNLRMPVPVELSPRHEGHTSAPVLIRDATLQDWPAIWPLVREIVAAGETFSYDPDMEESGVRKAWLIEPPGRTVVAANADGVVLGSAKMHPNQGGPGSHVATASFMVAREHSGKGVGRALGEHALAWARTAGYRAMQFNAVAASNTRALRLWRSLGFEVLATIPDGFRHPSLGYVGLHIMYRRL